MNRPSFQIPLMIYAGLMSLLSPLWRCLLRARSLYGKEDPNRLKERRGLSSIQRPDGPVIWVHGASIGEARLALGWAHYILKDYPGVCILLTTQTLSAYHCIKSSLSERIIHQMAPMDVPFYLKRFLSHWQPRLLCIFEAECWPLMLIMSHARGVALWTLNARLSKRSFSRWQWIPFFIVPLYALFDKIVTSCHTSQKYFGKLLGKIPDHGPSLKYASAPLMGCVSKDLEISLNGRLFWLASCIHTQEEDLFINTAKALKEQFPDLLWIVIPRHIERSEFLTEKAWPLHVQKRSSQPIPLPETDIFCVDTLGEVGLFYQLASFVVLGGSFADIGGHNLIEPALFQCAVIHGPDMHNNQDICDDFSGISLSVTKESLTETVASLLKNPEKSHALAEKTYLTVMHLKKEMQHLLQSLSDSLKVYF